MLLVNGEKMSKSLGNFFTPRRSARETFWRQHFACSCCKRIIAARSISASSAWKARKARWLVLRARLVNLRWAAAHATGEPDAALAQKLADAVAAADAEFKACMNDDFNTAGALGAFFGFITEGIRTSMLPTVRLMPRW